MWKDVWPLWILGKCLGGYKGVTHFNADTLGMLKVCTGFVFEPWSCSTRTTQTSRQVCNVFSQSMQTYDELLFKKHWQYTEMHKQTWLNKLFCFSWIWSWEINLTHYVLLI